MSDDHDPNVYLNRRTRRALESGKHVGELNYQNVVRRILSDPVSLALTIDMKTAWLLVHLCQTVIQQPNIGPEAHEWYSIIGRQFQTSIVARYPESEILLERGWLP